MANLKDIKEVPVVESLTGEEKVLINANGAAKQVSVKDLTDHVSQVPEVLELSGEETVLINVDGELKQVRVNQIKPKEEYDLDITVRFYFDEQIGDAATDFVIHHMSSFETIRDKILSGIVPKVKGILIDDGTEGAYTDPISYYDFEYYIDKINNYEEIYLYLGGYDYGKYFRMESDGSVYID